LKLAEPTLTLYSRRGCHLCDDMLAVLNEFSDTYHYRVEVRDIDLDPALHAKFNTLVPALYLGEHEICHYFLDLESLQSALEQHRP
jgi:glutaredoxin